MNSVPRCAISNRPTRWLTAPVNAPLVWPNSSASTSASGIAAALKATKRWSARALLWCRVRAISSLPVPVSPWIRTVLFIGAMSSSVENTCCIAVLWPMMLSKR